MYGTWQREKYMKDKQVVRSSQNSQNHNRIPMAHYTIETIKSFWGVTDIQVIGQYSSLNDSHNEFGNLICEGKVLLHPYNGRRISVLVNSSTLTFDKGGYYQFSLTFEQDQFELNENSSIPLIIDPNVSIVKVSNPYKSIIDECFSRFDEPDSNKVIASLLQEVGRGMYSSKKRIFFELLQNADDQPISEGPVKVFVKTTPNYFLFMHDAAPFSEADVRSITSAAESTKARNKKKTGYKGIGFKSVFSDASKVIINSGGFLFAFDKNHEVFSSFEEMYINRHELYSKNEDSKKYLLNKYQNRKHEFEDIRNIPWQIKPIWIDQIDEELSYSEYAEPNNVWIAVYFGSEKIQAYEAEVTEVMLDPRFLLFLRNVNFVQHNNIDKRVEAIRHPNLTEVSILQNGDEKHRYRIKEFRVPLSSEVFSEVGLDIVIGSKRYQHDNNVTERAFFNGKGEELTNIPPKIATFEEISIYFAAPQDGQAVIPEASYISGERQSYVFTYLPMKEDRLKFPFLVNSDFVPSSNREAIQGDNVWNLFLFYHIGFRLVDWIAELANSVDSGNKYLNLLVPHLLSMEGSDIKEVEEWFNKGYQQGLQTIAFIPSGKESRLLQCREAILDTTGLTDVFNQELFYTLFETPLHLPKAKLDVKVLENDLFGIAKFTDSALYQTLTTTSTKQATFEDAILHLDSLGYKAFLSWFDKWCSRLTIQQRNYIAATLRIFRFEDNTLASWNTLKEANQPHFATHIILHSQFFSISAILTTCSSYLSAFEIDKDYPVLFGAFTVNESYLNNDLRLFELLAKVVDNGRDGLSGAQKVELLKFIKGLHQVGPDRYARSLSLFKSKTGVHRPLEYLIASQTTGLPSSLDAWVIDLQEEVYLQDFSNHLVNNQNLFERIYLVTTFFEELSKNIAESQLEDFTEHILISYSACVEKERLKSAIPNIPWLFISTEKGFQKASEVYCPDVLLASIPREKYDNIRKILVAGAGKLIPHYDSLHLISGIGLSCQKQSIYNVWGNNVIKIPEEMLLHFLEILLEAKEKDYFTKWYITQSEEGFQIKLKQQGFKQNVIASDEVKRWIVDEPQLANQLEILPDNLVFDKLEEIGIWRGEDLLKRCIKLSSPPLSLIMRIQKSADEDLKKLFLLQIKELPINTEEEYSQEHDINQTMKLGLHFAQLDETGSFAASFRSKITLNGAKLENEAISDRVVVKVGELGRFELSLSEILTDYKGESDVMSNALNAFPRLNQTDLKKHIFCLQEKSYKDIESDIRRQSQQYLSPMQVIFLILIAKKDARSDVFNGLTHFDNYFQESDWSKVEFLYQELLSLLKKIDLTDIKSHFSFLNFDPVECVFDELAVSREQVPGWVLEWLGPKDHSDYNDRLAFLFKLGINQTESNVVRLRRSMLNRDVEMCKACITEIKERKLLVNSLKWLQEKQLQQRDLILHLFSVVSHILERISDLDMKEWLVPVLTDFWNYELVNVENKKFHTYQNSWYHYRYNLLKYTRAKGEFLLPETLPESVLTKLNPEKADPKIVHSIKLETAKEWTAPHYITWESRSEFPIFIYSGEKLPWNVLYMGEVVTEIHQGYSTKWEGKYYVTSNMMGLIPLEYPIDYPIEQKMELIKRQVIGIVEEEPDDTYVGIYERQIKGKNPELDTQIAFNKEAIMRGIVHLHEQGYALDESTYIDNDKVLHNLKKDNINYSFFFRSARGGLLYVNPKYWFMLEDRNISLVVVYPGGGIRIFSNKEDLMRDQMNPYILIRTSNTGDPSDIDKMINNTYGDTNLLFVTSHEMYQKLYHDNVQRGNNPPVVNRGIADNTFDL